MSDPTLIAVYENGLHPKVKMLYAILHAYTDDNGVAVEPEEKIAGILDISLARLRGYRSALNKSGYATVNLSAGNLIFMLAGDHPARESDHPARGGGGNQEAGGAAGDHPARDSDHPVITDDTPAAPGDHPARTIARGARDSDHSARAGGGIKGGGRLVGINSSTLSGEKTLPTNQPVSATVKTERWEAEATEGLLLEMGCESVPVVRTIAQTVPFEEVRAHALAWQRDTKAQGPGALITRIRSESFAVPILTDDDRRSSLFLRHRTPAEIADDAQRQAEAAEKNQRWEAEQEARRLAQAQAQEAPASPPTPDTRHPTPDTSSPDDAHLVAARQTWQMALNELALSLPAPTFEAWVRDTNVLNLTDGEFVIGVPTAYARDWLGNRLRPQIKRILGRLCQRSVEVTFTVRPRPQMEAT